MVVAVKLYEGAGRSGVARRSAGRTRLSSVAGIPVDRSLDALIEVDFDAVTETFLCHGDVRLGVRHIALSTRLEDRLHWCLECRPDPVEQVEQRVSPSAPDVGREPIHPGDGGCEEVRPDHVLDV